MELDERTTLEAIALGINTTRAELYETQSRNRINENAFFSILMALIIFTMQIGFAFLEAGTVRAKNCTNILAKNLLDSLITIIGYWSVGWALAYGRNADAYSAPFVGWSEFFGVGVANYARFFFQYVFAARASTIISGAVAERCEFVTFITYSIVISSTVYPIMTHWGWSENGWLKTGIQVGDLKPTTYIDIAGSGVVHLCGGTISLIAAFLMKPRIGRFDDKNKTHEELLQGHSVPLAALGGFILMFGFLAFNGGAIADISGHGAGQNVALAMINTILSGAFAALTCMLIFYRLHGKWSLLLTINACLAGMVSTCASCSLIKPWATPFVGIGAALIYIGLSILILKIHIDDPLDSFAVHAGGGIWGLIAVCLFGKGALLPSLFSGNGVLQPLAQLGWNLFCAVIIMAWSALTMTPVFLLLKCIGVLRVSAEVETKGLDYVKHGETAYPLAAYGHGWKALPKKSMQLPSDDIVTQDAYGVVTIYNDSSTYAPNNIVQRHRQKTSGN